MLHAALERELSSSSDSSAPLIPMLDTVSAQDVDDSHSMAPAASVEQLVKRHLHHSSYASLRQIDCKVSSGTVQLTGQLPSFYLKQTAQEIVRRIVGIQRICNQLEVLEY